MNEIPIWLLVSNCVMFIVALGVFSAGRKIPRQGDWLILVAILACLIAIILSWVGTLDQGWEHTKQFGWVFGGSEDGSLKMGIAVDSISLIPLFLLTLSSGLILLGRIGKGSPEERVRDFSSVLLGLSGVGIALFSTTVWMGLVGWIITLLAGAWVLREDRPGSGAGVDAFRFLFDRFVAFALVLFGVAGSADGNGLNGPGAVVALSGILLQMQGFPMIGRQILAPGIRAEGVRLAVTQVFPAWVALGLVFRFFGELETAGHLQEFGWVAVAFSALTSLVGFFQRDWRRSLSLLFSAELILAMALAAIESKAAGFSLAVGATLSTFALSSIGEGTDVEAPHPRTTATLGVKLAVYLALAVACGFVLFVPAVAWTSWILSRMADPAILAAIVSLLLVFFIHAWTTGEKLVKAVGPAPLSHWQWALTGSFALGGTLLVWVGEPAVGVSADSKWARSIIEEALKFSVSGAQSGEQDRLTAVLIGQGLILISAMISYWLAGTQTDRIDSIRRSIPRGAGFLERGYSLDGLFVGLRTGIQTLGAAIARGVDAGVWSRWIPQAGGRSISVIGRAMQKMDRSVTSGLNRGSWGTLSGLGRLVQSGQTGDLQHYLLIVIGAAFLVLLKFILKTGI